MWRKEKKREDYQKVIFREQGKESLERDKQKGRDGQEQEKNKARQGIRRSERQRSTDKQKEQNEWLIDDCKNTGLKK